MISSASSTPGRQALGEPVRLHAVGEAVGHHLAVLALGGRHLLRRHAEDAGGHRAVDVASPIRMRPAAPGRRPSGREPAARSGRSRPRGGRSVGGDEDSPEAAYPTRCAPGCCGGWVAPRRAGRCWRRSGGTRRGSGRRPRPRSGARSRRWSGASRPLGSAGASSTIGCCVAQALEGRRVGRVPGLGLALRLESELVVEDRAQLRGGVDVELVSGELVDLLFELVGLVDQLGRRSGAARRCRRGCRPPPCARGPARAGTRPRRAAGSIPARSRSLRSRGTSRSTVAASTAAARARSSSPSPGTEPAVVESSASCVRTRTCSGATLAQVLAHGHGREPVAARGGVEKVGGNGRCP